MSDVPGVSGSQSAPVPVGGGAGSSSLPAAELALLADELGALASTVPGVARVQPRPGISRFAKRVVGEIAAAAGAGSWAPLPPDVTITVSRDVTLVELDLVIDADHSGPAVARDTAARIRDRLRLEVLPVASLDVRIVGVAG